MSTTMAHWPPQPCVEDEVTSLEHEQILPSLAETLKDDDDPAVSRGDVDQYPIIVDSDDQRRTAPSEGKLRGRSNKTATETSSDDRRRTTKFDNKPAPLAATKAEQLNSSDDSAGPATPPPIYQSHVRKGLPPGIPKSVAIQGSNERVPLEPPPYQESRGRPQVARIDTNLGAELNPVVTGDRRVPSPYSYTRPSPTIPLYSSQQFNASLSAQQRQPSQLDSANTNSHNGPRSSVDLRAVMSDEPDVSGRQRRRQRSRSRPRSRSQRRGSSTQFNRRLSNMDAGGPRSSENRLPPPSPRIAKDSNYCLSPAAALQYPADQQAYTPPQSRQPSREPRHAADVDRGYSTRYSRAGRDGRSQQESPYTSSAEESSKNLRPHRGGQLGPNTPARRPSTQRRERPIPDELQDQMPSRKSVSSAANEKPYTGRDANRRSYHEPVTPLTADPARSMEAYVERAFKNNETKSAQRNYHQRNSSSAVASPFSSPPRTPRSERQSRDYFDMEPSSQRAAQRSRPPSMDEGSSAALKHHVAILSAATAGAALAARASNDQSHSGKSSTTARSRRPSPVLEEAPAVERPLFTNPSDGPRAIHAPTPSYNRQPDFQSMVNDRELATPHSHAQRSASYSGYDPPRNVPAQQYGTVPELDQKRMSTGFGVSPLTTARPPLPRAHTATDSTEKPPHHLRLPVCPRPSLVAGYHDWWSVKEISNIDICPTCMAVLRTTPFNHLFVPSLPRPYNEPSVCAMSKPWVRIAFMRAYRQGLPDLDYVRDVSILPPETRACAGDKSDVRIWFNLIDPATQEPIPNFFACSACTRAIDKVFPELEHVLTRPKSGLNQENICSLRCSSKHFAAFIDTFAAAASRVRDKSRQTSERLQPLTSSIRKICRYRECTRDKFLPTRAWHFMPDLPEFTVCEECYNEVIWPINDKPLARDICKTTKIVPIRRNSNGDTGISCQLYSERMRKVFRDAVANKSFSHLRDAARERQALQVRLHSMNRALQEDQTRLRIDRRDELDRNQHIWQKLQ